MSAVPAVEGGERYPVRVFVTPVWDYVTLQADDQTPVAQLKREALRAALKRANVNDAEYVVKFRGAAVLDESVILRSLGAKSNSPFVVLPAHRQPVR